MNNLEDNDFENLTKAIKLIQSQVKWKSINKAEIHLAKRIKLGHLPNNSSLDDYQKVIQTIILDDESEIYIFQDNNCFYPTVTNKIDYKFWIVMFSLSGIMETAFPPSNPEKYLKNNPFVYIGKLKELI
ncbi:MAG: hypothetical protein IGQ45_08825 [Cyanobacterium sp. T60_A2020_053]|nr:hypothetical protein [Cyanobacterium sp. T60_A2020_053]